MKLKICEVGLFKLPGISLARAEITPEQLTEIESWCQETGCGQRMTDTLWSFRNNNQRDMFILRWSS